MARATGSKNVTRSGRVSAKPQKHEEEDVDGCDFEFIESEVTRDAELPAAKGGVEVKRKSRTRQRRRP